MQQYHANYWLELKVERVSSILWVATDHNGVEKMNFFHRPPIIRYSVDTAGIMRVEAHGIDAEDQPCSIIIAEVHAQVEVVNA